MLKNTVSTSTYNILSTVLESAALLTAAFQSIHTVAILIFDIDPLKTIICADLAVTVTDGLLLLLLYFAAVSLA